MATSLPDAKVAARHYRQRMQPEQCFRDGKQYFALDRGTATTTARLGRTLVGLLLAGRRASWQFGGGSVRGGKLGLLRLGMERYLATPEPPPDGLACPTPKSGYARGVAGHFRQPAQQTGASEAPVGQQQRTDGIRQIAHQACDKSLFQPVLRRVQFIVGVARLSRGSPRLR